MKMKGNDNTVNRRMRNQTSRIKDAGLSNLKVILAKDHAPKIRDIAKRMFEESGYLYDLLTPGLAYLLELKGIERSFYKVIYTTDIDSYIQALNDELISEITGCSWSIVQEQKFDAPEDAFVFVRLVLDEVESYQDVKSGLIDIDEVDLKAFWKKIYEKEEYLDPSIQDSFLTND